MSQMVFWMLGIAFSAGAMMFTVALDAHLGQFALSAVIATFITVSAVRDFEATDGIHPSRRAAVLIRHMGMLWSWAAMSLVLIYAFLLSWSAWLGVFLVVTLGSGLCLFIANVLDRDAAADAHDVSMIGIVDKIAKVQFAATCVAIGGLIAFGKLSVAAFGGEAKWAAVNILLCMGMALAGLSGFTIVQSGALEESAEEPPRAAAPVVPRATSPREAPAATVPGNRMRQAARVAPRAA